ncbi:MAG: hypothetical protein JWQ29_1482 [Phenylobacterium sp.]|nr:hypothetical protein [Phenylobacterium sp.]
MFSNLWPAVRRHLAACALAFATAATLVAVSGSGAHAATFVDAGLPEVAADKRVVIANPQPVQLLFQFQTKGAPNAQATKLVKPSVVDAVKASGLFSEVSEGPASNGAVLNVIIDNVVEPGAMTAAAGKGAVTGATLFIAGSTIQEHYASSIDYIGGTSAPKITRTARHSIYTQMGMINSPPPNGVKVEGGLKGAVFLMARQIVSNPLNDLASDPAFAPPFAPPLANLASPAEVVPAAATAAPTSPTPADKPAASPS